MRLSDFSRKNRKRGAALLTRRCRSNCPRNGWKGRNGDETNDFRKDLTSVGTVGFGAKKKESGPEGGDPPQLGFMEKRTPGAFFSTKGRPAPPGKSPRATPKRRENATSPLVRAIKRRKRPERARFDPRPRSPVSTGRMSGDIPLPDMFLITLSRQISDSQVFATLPEKIVLKRPFCQVFILRFQSIRPQTRAESEF